MEVNDAVVQCLVRDQRPDLVDRPLVRVTNGWDNVTFRLGDDLAVRLPPRAEAVPLTLHEQGYLPTLPAAPRWRFLSPSVPAETGVPQLDDNPRKFSVGEFGIRQILEG